MAKKKELSKSDKEYLDNHRDDDVKELSKDVNVVLGVVRKYMEDMPEKMDVAIEPEKRDVNEQDKDVVVKKEENPQAKVDHLFGRHETREGIVVSTPAASEMADATRHHRINKGNKTESMIHRCKPKK